MLAITTFDLALALEELATAWVGWVERSETHQFEPILLMGFGYRLYPSHRVISPERDGVYKTRPVGIPEKRRAISI